MNTLRITLLLSILMVPRVAFSTDDDSSGGSTPGSDQEVSVQRDESGSSHRTADPTTTDMQLEDSKDDRGHLDTPSESPSKNNASSLLGSAAAWAYWPVELTGDSIDWIADKTFVVSGIGRLAALKGLEGNRIGNWLTNHNKGLSRAVVVALIGSAVYYYWKKCHQECKKAQDESSRAVGFGDDDIEFDNFLEVQEG